MLSVSWLIKLTLSLWIYAHVSCHFLLTCLKVTWIGKKFEIFCTFHLTSLLLLVYVFSIISIPPSVDVTQHLFLPLPLQKGVPVVKDATVYSLFFVYVSANYSYKVVKRETAILIALLI